MQHYWFSTVLLIFYCSSGSDSDVKTSGSSEEINHDGESSEEMDSEEDEGKIDSELFLFYSEDEESLKVEDLLPIICDFFLCKEEFG